MCPERSTAWFVLRGTRHTARNAPYAVPTGRTWPSPNVRPNNRATDRACLPIAKDNSSRLPRDHISKLRSQRFVSAEQQALHRRLRDSQDVRDLRILHFLVFVHQNRGTLL